MNNPLQKTIFIVDDDKKVRDALLWLFTSVQLPVETFDSASQFIDKYKSNRPGCLIIDVRMPGMSGLELLELLKLNKCHLPIIVITGHGDIPMAVRAMKAGAVDFICKPFNDQYLLDQIQKTLNQNHSADDTQQNELISACFATLTSREKDILVRITDGQLNKQIAYELNIAQSTVETTRSKIMKKMQAKTMAQLIKNYVMLELD